MPQLTKDGVVNSSRQSSTGMVRWSGTQTSGHNGQGVNQDTVYEASVCAATPNWGTVLSCQLDQK